MYLSSVCDVRLHTYINRKNPNLPTDVTHLVVRTQKKVKALFTIKDVITDKLNSYFNAEFLQFWFVRHDAFTANCLSEKNAIVFHQILKIYRHWGHCLCWNRIHRLSLCHLWNFHLNHGQINSPQGPTLYFKYISFGSNLSNKEIYITLKFSNGVWRIKIIRRVLLTNISWCYLE